MAIENSSLDKIFSPWHTKPMNSPIHPLRRWLFEHQETATQFASRAGLAQGYLSQIIAGKKRPTLDMIDKITKATDRAITANDFQHQEPMP